MMDVDRASEVMRQTFTLVLMLAAPMLIAGLLVGLIVSIFQAVTQIQEQTLSFIPRIAAMVGVAILTMPWTAHRLMEFASAMFGGGALP
jgi:flagellar biosynthesis protein FliQ